LNSTLALYNTITKLSNLIIQYLHRVVIPKIKKENKIKVISLYFRCCKI
jgi:hypothetical protein